MQGYKNTFSKSNVSMFCHKLWPMASIEILNSWFKIFLKSYLQNIPHLFAESGCTDEILPDATLLCELIRQRTPILNWKVKSSMSYGKINPPICHMLIFFYRVDFIQNVIWSECRCKCEISLSSFCSHIMIYHMTYHQWKFLCSYYLNTDVVVCEVESKILWEFDNLGIECSHLLKL